MKERPIIFSGESVRAILAGRKTQTRRVITRQHLIPPTTELRGFGGDFSVAGHDFRCPFGRPGDRLWVRETWHDCGSWHRLPGAEGDDPRDYVWRSASAAPNLIRYAADDPVDLVDVNDRPRPYWHHRKRPPIHMPRWASRLTLEVVSVRVERLQAITEADAKAEGVAPGETTDGDLSHALGFIDTWDRLNAKRGHPWESNPWVWVVEFKRTEDER